MPAVALPTAAACRSCGTENPPETNFCRGCGIRLQGESPSPRPAVAAPAPAPPAPSGAASCRLIAVRRDGSDGDAHPLRGDQIDIGGADGALVFDDPHLARRHARVSKEGSVYTLIPLEARNGVYVRLRAPLDLDDGQYILLGKQVLRFELMSDVEKIVRPALEHGVVLFGTPVKAPWARLRQMTAAGTARDIHHLCRTEVVLGREQGDIVFSDDEFLSRRHAQVSFRGGRARLEDLGSSNGTFARLAGPHPLTSGEMIRLGDELLRFELG